jgi:hypothetical protein
MAHGIIAGAFLLSSCASGVNLSRIKTADLITTSSVQSSRDGKIDQEAISDRSTIRNAVSSVSLDQLGHAPLHWENKDTGSKGIITSIEEYRDGQVICRRFTTTRESFDGVAIYHGDACLGDGGVWWYKDFGPA